MVLQPEDADKTTAALPAGGSVTFTNAVIVVDVDATLCDAINAGYEQIIHFDHLSMSLHYFSFC